MGAKDPEVYLRNTQTYTRINMKDDGPELAVRRLKKIRIWVQLKKLMSDLEEATAQDRLGSGFFDPEVGVNFKPDPELTVQSAAEVLEFIAHPARWRIVYALTQVERMDGPELRHELARADIECSQPVYSQHLTKLIEKGYVKRYKLPSGKITDLYELNHTSWRTRLVEAVMQMFLPEGDVDVE